MQNDPSLPAVFRSDFPLDEHEISTDRFGPYRKLHRALRGRYFVLFLLALAGASAGAMYGYRKAVAAYRSEGLIQVAYVLPAVMQHTDQNEPMQMYEEYLESQVLLMSSKEVLDKALKDSVWYSASKQSVPTDTETFGLQLLVEHPPHTQAIRVSYVSPDPEAAAAGVRSVISSYVAYADAADSAGDSDRLKVLNDRKVELTNRIHEVIEKMPQQAVPLNQNQVAMFDDLMRDYMKQINAVRAELQEMQSRGAGPSHPVIKGMQAELDRLTDQTKQYKDDFQKMQLALAASPNDSSGRSAVVPQYQPFQTTLTELRKDLEETNKRVETLQLESSSGHRRLTILSQGEVPATAYKDRRVLQAAAGGMGGAILPAVLIAFLGLSSGRMRYSDDANTKVRDFRLLGILPKLPGRISDPVLAGIASHCIHHLRLKLQMMGKQDRRVFMITSCVSGEGKTSLTMALGLSFAASGSRTLIIDADTIGRTLTYRLGAVNDPGLVEAVDQHITDNLLKPVSDKLWLLPSGQCEHLTPASLSPGTVEMIIAELRSKFDYILIDTGPVLASLEASTVAMCADEVVLIVSPGQQASMVHQAWKTLKAINANVPGYVFNKAVAKDYGRMVDDSSNKYFTSRPAVSPRSTTLAPAVIDHELFDPLVQSVNFLKADRLKNGTEHAARS